MSETILGIMRQGGLYVIGELEWNEKMEGKVKKLCRVQIGSTPDGNKGQYQAIISSFFDVSVPSGGYVTLTEEFLEISVNDLLGYVKAPENLRKDYQKRTTNIIRVSPDDQRVKKIIDEQLKEKWR